MFISLLLVTFAIAIVVSFILAKVFKRPIEAILHRIVAEELSSAWARYITFAIYVVGISGGVRIRQIERYITSDAADAEPLILTGERWTLEIYRTIIEALQAVAWMLLVFFLFALIAFVVVKGFELRHERKSAASEDRSAE